MTSVDSVLVRTTVNAAAVPAAKARRAGRIQIQLARILLLSLENDVQRSTGAAHGEPGVPRLSARARHTGVTTPRGVPGFLPAAPRLELCKPRQGAQAHPDRRQQHVEEDERNSEPTPPDGPTPPGHRRLRPHVVLALASALRPSTVRRIRCAVSSIESSEMSITGQPRRRWIADASSSSS